MPQTRSILHSDLNCYYAAVEMLRNPRLRNIPFAVCGSKSERRGIVLTANYPAKRLGVKTGMAIWEAQRVYKDLVIVPANMEYYIQFSEFVREIYKDYTDTIEAFGLDENWLDVTGSVGLFGNGETIAREIQMRVAKELGLQVSIGVSDNKIFSKLGSDYNKPLGLTVINQDNYKEIVWPLPVGDLLYVGRKTQAKLAGKYIRTIGELAALDTELLVCWFGKIGAMLSAFARGEDLTPVAHQDDEAPVKSVGNSSTCPRDLENCEDAKIMFYTLAESVAARMIEQGFAATTVSISWRTADCEEWHSCQHKLPVTTNLSGQLVEAALDLFTKRYHWHKPLRSVGIKGMNLVAADSVRQLTFEVDAARMARLETLEQTVIALRERYGNKIIQRGMMYADPFLSKIDAKKDHTVHPVGYFQRGGVIIWNGINTKICA